MPAASPVKSPTYCQRCDSEPEGAKSNANIHTRTQKIVNNADTNSIIYDNTCTAFNAHSLNWRKAMPEYIFADANTAMNTAARGK